MEKFRQPNNSQSKFPKMKIFQSIQRNFATIGITVDLATQSYPLNGRIFVGVSILASIAICNFIYIFYEAETSAEYTEAIFMSTIAIPFFLALMILILNVKLMFKSIQQCENLVNTSELANRTVLPFKASQIKEFTL